MISQIHILLSPFDLIYMSFPFDLNSRKQAMGDGAAIVAYIMKPSRVEDFAKVITIFNFQFSNIRGFIFFLFFFRGVLYQCILLQMG